MDSNCLPIITTPVHVYILLCIRRVTTVVGQFRTARKDFPKDLIIAKNTKVNRGYIDYKSNGPVLAVAWQDRRNIYFISMMHKAELTSGQNEKILMVPELTSYALPYSPTFSNT